MSDKQPKYELITYNGHNEAYQGKMVRLYPDGTIKNDQGKWIERPPGSAELINPDNARALSLARQEKYKQAAAEAVEKEIGAIAPGVNTPFAAWGWLNGKLAVQIADSEKPRGRDLEYLGRNMGAIAAPADAGGAASGDKDTHYRQFVADLADLVRARE